MVAGFRPSLIAPLAALALAGCVAQDGFPSLALRPAEREVSFEPPVRPRVEVPNDVGLRTRLSELQGRASDGDRAFHAALGATEGAAAQAGAAESESWVEAQQALSRLESTREPTTRALSDLDQLALSRADMPTSDEDNALLDAARESIERLAAAQQQRVDRLRSRLGSR